ncbi:MAG: oxygen-independent coproporphyrinogen III oxidase [Pseudomonadota bacterium]
MTFGLTAVQARAKYMTRAVPRYTSYPTAPHFGAVVGEESYRDWLRKLDPADPISLYLHVPFCRKLCWYCGCNMKLATRDAPLVEYARDLKREIVLLAQALPARTKISHLHWGGGTPTALSPDDLERVMGTVRGHFDFTDDAEIALESDPRTLTAAMVDRIGDLGFTRASFGVQEFDPTVQKAINRIQPPEMVANSVTQLRSVGVSGINFDLIYGLPHQTTDMIRRTIQLCTEMRPDRIALFGYAHVPWMAKKQRLIDADALPGAMERLEQAEAASETLLKMGYQAVGLDHFALPSDPLAIAERDGTLHRNFQGYTIDKATTLLGVGATSIGRTPYGYVQNQAETGAWARAVSAGHLPVGKGLTFTGEDALRGDVIERLMCFGQVDLEAASVRHNTSADWWTAKLDEMAELAVDGIVTFNGGILSLTEEGRPLARVVAALFDEYLVPETESGVKRHSVAV